MYRGGNWWVREVVEACEVGKKLLWMHRERRRRTMWHVDPVGGPCGRISMLKWPCTVQWIGYRPGANSHKLELAKLKSTKTTGWRRQKKMGQFCKRPNLQNVPSFSLQFQAFWQYHSNMECDVATAIMWEDEWGVSDRLRAQKGQFCCLRVWNMRKKVP